MVKRGIQKRGIDLIFGETERQKQPERVIHVKPSIILYGRDDINPATQNFTKYPNEIHPVMRDMLKGKEAAAIVFMYLWRISFGFGKNYCRVSLQTIERETVVGSRKTVQRAINYLSAARFIVKGKLESGGQNKTQEGCLYRVLTPKEIANGITEEDVVIDDIPDKAIVILTPSTKPNNNKILSNSDNLGGDKLTLGQIDTTQIDTTGGDKMGGDKMTPLLENRINKQSSRWGQNVSTQIDTPFKEDNLKDSLSLDPIESFYIGIGQKRITKTKREKGEKVTQELEADGFSLEDIQFAVKWTLKNAKEKPYDFSLLKDTIGQAISARHIEQQTTHKAREKAARTNIAEAERRRLEDEIQKIRKGMSEKGLVELREKALKKIRNTDGIKEQFINEPLIIAKENEILRSENGISTNGNGNP